MSLDHLRKLAGLELIYGCPHVSDELRPFAPLPAFLGSLAVGFDEGRQVRRGEIADLLSVGVASLDEIHVALLR